MTKSMIAIALVAASFGAGTAAAAPAGGFEVRNQTGGTVYCAVKPDGSSRAERFLLKRDAVWSKSYSKSKDRRLRCDGAYSTWHRIAAGRSYVLVRTGSGMITVRPAGGS